MCIYYICLLLILSLSSLLTQPFPVYVEILNIDFTFTNRTIFNYFQILTALLLNRILFNKWSSKVFDYLSNWCSFHSLFFILSKAFSRMTYTYTHTHTPTPEHLIIIIIVIIMLILLQSILTIVCVKFPFDQSNFRFVNFVCFKTFFYLTNQMWYHFTFQRFNVFIGLINFLKKFYLESIQLHSSSLPSLIEFIHILYLIKRHFNWLYACLLIVSIHFIVFLQFLHHLQVFVCLFFYKLFLFNLFIILFHATDLVQETIVFQNRRL